jgi:glycosyltransferase involved in cell wall biosynthesis
MRILVTSLPDLTKMPPQRPHQLVGHLAEANDVTVLCSDVWWQDDIHDSYLDAILSDVELQYMSRRKVNSIIQEVLFCVGGFRAFDHDHHVNEYDLHLNLDSPIAGYYIAKKTTVPTIFDIYDDYVAWIKVSPQVPALLKPFGGVIGRVVLEKNVQSSARVTYITESLREVHNLPEKKARYIPNGVDTDLFSPQDPRKLRTELSLSDAFVVGYAGGLKSFIDLEPAFKALQSLQGIMEVKMLVVGEEGDFKRNVALAAKYGLADRVVFTGFVPRLDLPWLMSAMDVCLVAKTVLPATDRMLPLKLLEYMACEKPVISTPLRGVIDTVAKRVLYANDAATLRQHILELSSNGDMRKDLGRGGREFVQQHFSWRKILLDFDKVVAEVTNEVAR